MKIHHFQRVANRVQIAVQEVIPPVHHGPVSTEDRIVLLDRPCKPAAIVRQALELLIEREPDKCREGRLVALDLRPDETGDDQADERFEHDGRSEEHTSELQSLMRTSYAVFCLKKKPQQT